MMTVGKQTEELARLYDELDQETARRGWRCRACGTCCHFAEHGHELFCSEIEAEYLCEGAELPGSIGDDVCAFLREGRCTRHERRTLGCRTYFCEASGSGEMGLLAERFLRRLKRLHERWGRPWRYCRLADHLRRRKPLHQKR